MATGSNMDMLPTLDDCLQGPNGNLEDSLKSELELILRAQRNQRHSINREKDLSMYRSGSAPPTVEGSLNAVGSLFRNYNVSDVNNASNSNSKNVLLSDDEIRSHPAYLEYYYSHENLNPRLPPPLLSKEDWRFAQRFQAGGSSFGGIGELRKKLVDGGDSSSLFSMQPGLPVQKVDNDMMELRNPIRSNLSRKASAEWLDRGSDVFSGLQGSTLGTRRRSFADILQEGLDRPASSSGHLSSPARPNTFPDIVDTMAISNPHPSDLCKEVESLEGLRSGAAPSGILGAQNHGTALSHSFASSVGASLSRSTTPEQHLLGRSPSCGLPPLGNRIGPIEKKNVAGTIIQNGYSSGKTDLGEITDSLSGLSLSKSRHADQRSYIHPQMQLHLDNQPDLLFNISDGHNQNMQQKLRDKSNAESLSFATNYIDLARKNGVISNLNASEISSNGEVSITNRASANLQSGVNSSSLGSLESSKIHHQNVNISSLDFAGHVPGSYAAKPKLNSIFKNHLDAGSTLGGSGGGQHLNRLGNRVGPDFLSPVMDPHYMQYLQRASDYATHAVASPSGPPLRNYFGTSDGDLDGIQDGIPKGYLESLLAQQKLQYELSLLDGSGILHQGYYRNSSYGLGMPYPENLVTNCRLPSTGSGSLQNDRVARISSVMRSSGGGSMVSWHSDVGSNAERTYPPSLLDEFKNNKTRSFELSDIVGYVVDFSTDQYGSRFIQQKLETATVEEKNSIFPEIVPHARTLMTDVFGNYVIQKFFYHGTESQRMELASQLTGHVLPLSLQMYGCRVIQKALEMIDVDKQTQMVAELNGSVMKCIRDQNGNHVIQKCIECVPEDRIQFIISAFYGQVVSLSSHPYGCRVIQRVLEHCLDINTQQIIMDEIMQSVCTLAQDQYGNYVIQHVLEHGKLHERSAIICKLAGQIVKMSQQKYASNVVEKCLTFGGPEERQLLVNEMLGSTDENEPLQAMMKDPFGNYVVQKVLETCNDQSLELILSRIKVHLSALKRYTYGKHIVSRIEKLITTGERRIGLSASISS